MIRIKSAIIHYNENVREEGMPKMTGKTLGIFIMEKNGATYVSWWGNGKHLGKLKPDHVEKICEATGVDANFLFGIRSMHNRGSLITPEENNPIKISFNKSL